MPCRRALVISLALTAVLALSVAVFAEEPPPAPPAKSADAPASDADADATKAAPPKTGQRLPAGKPRPGTPLVLTNDTLERRYRHVQPSTPAPARGTDDSAANEAPMGAAVNGRRDATSADPPAAGSAGESQANAEKLREELDRLQKRVASIRNPYLARGQATDDEKAREAGLDNAERLRLLQEQIENVRSELAKAGESNRDGSSR